MPDGDLMFWMVHIFIGLLLPFLVLSGCCREQEEKTEASSQQQ